MFLPLMFLKALQALVCCQSNPPTAGNVDTEDKIIAGDDNPVEDRPTLHHLVTHGRYTEALACVEEHGVDELSGMPTLHELVRMIKPSAGAIAVAEAICSRLPNLVKLETKGETPLQTCVSSRRAWSPASNKYEEYPRCAGMALTLIHACPEACKLSFAGKTPFDLACEADAHMDVLKAMLKVDPTLASHTHTVFLKEVPVFGPKREIAIRKRPIDLLWAAKEPAIDKLGLILLTILEGRVVDPLPTSTLLHAACSDVCHCPWDLFLLIFNEYSSQASTRDTRGNLPLHYAVRKLGGHIEVIRKLIAANPEALHAVDATDGLLPVLQSALYGNSWNTYHLSVTYELLLAAPDVVLRALSK